MNAVVSDEYYAPRLQYRHRQYGAAHLGMVGTDKISPVIERQLRTMPGIPAGATR